MANEAVLRVRLQDPIDMTVADGTGIEKGAILALSDPLTAALATAPTDRIAGVAAREKIANDGRTRLAVYRRGIFDMVASGAIAVGATVSAAGAPANTVIASTVAEVASETLGIALETASDGETIQVELNPGVQTNAFA